jgi:hypothetical protein
MMLVTTLPEVLLIALKNVAFLDCLALLWDVPL